MPNAVIVVDSRPAVSVSAGSYRALHLSPLSDIDLLPPL